MKKLSNFFGNTKVMTLAAFAGMSTVFGLSSCQQDDYFDEPTYTANATQSMNQEKESVNDTVFVNDFQFNYDKLGTSSPDQYVADIDFGFSSPTAYRSTRSAVAAVSALDVIKTVISAVSTGTSVYKAFAEDPVVTKLEDVTNELKEVKGMIAKLKEEAVNREVAEYYNAHMWDYYSFETNGSYLGDFLMFLRNNDVQSAYEIADNWANQTFKCGEATKGIKDLMRFIPTFTTGGNMNIVQMYDYWVYQTTPWEHQGYQKRQQLRDGDICMCTSGYILARAHYEHQFATATREADKSAARIEIKNLDDAFDAFCTFYKDNYDFPRHYDKLICQIEGANIVFNKDIKIRDMKNHPWQSNNTSNWGMKTLMYGDVNTNFQTVLDRSINLKEAEAIFNYYKNSKQKDSNEKLTFENIMKGAKFELDGLDANKKHILTLSDGCWREKEHWYNYNYDLYYNHVVVANDENPIRKDWKLGCMWITSEKIHYCSDVKETLKWWDHYTTDDCQYFYTNIEKRYNGMYPLDKKQN